MIQYRHTARPGPQYWDWRCLTCGGHVDDRSLHRPWWKWWGA